MSPAIGRTARLSAAGLLVAALLPAAGPMGAQTGRPGRVTAAPTTRGLEVVDAVFELCVRDLDATARFYREGIGMRQVQEPQAGHEVLLEWAGSYLRLRQVAADAPATATATGHPMRQMLAANGFRWFSLWLDDPAAVADRLAAAGYPRPSRGASVYLTRDPENNVVELMGVPRSAQGETFTWGMVAGDEGASLAFYRDVLSLGEFEPWDLPPPYGMKMYLFAAGSGRLKFSAPPGRRSRDADAGLDAPGLRSVTLRVADLEAARQGLVERGAKVEGERRVLVTDPDGNRIYVEQAPQKTPARNATGQLFERVAVPGLTSIREGMNGVAIADLNKDGLLDIVATYSAPRGTGERWGSGERLRVFINQDERRFREHTIRLLGSQVTPDAFGRGQVPALADFNGDGFLDLFVTRHAQMTAGRSNPRDQGIGNGLYVSEGAWDVFRDVSAHVGIQNERAYNRQPSIGDVDRDGWLDIAVGADNIGNAMGGVPHSRLYVFRPNGGRFEDGRFEDIGGTGLVPDFGGFYHDSARDKAGPDINLRDLDNDGDLDLLQSFHVDIRDPTLPYSPIEYRQGVFNWKNLLAETGELRFEKVTENGLASEAHLELNDDKRTFTAVGKAPGLPYISLADVDNDGLLDVLAVGPASPGWAPRTEYVSGRFWRNQGGFRFREETAAAGLSALNWVYRDWWRFFGAAPPAARRLARADPGERRPYLADAVFGDFDNDGWVDVVVLDRSEMQSPRSRAMLFMNRGDGTFEPKPTTFSGLDGSGICGEAADLDNDGLVDLVFAADPDNSGLASGMDRYESRVYMNTGLHGARENHWLRVRFSGVADAELIGARVLAYRPGEAGRPDARPIGMRAVHPAHSYKSGGALEAHFGMGRLEEVDLTITTLDGRTTRLDGLHADRFLDVDLATGTVTEVRPAVRGR